MLKLDAIHAGKSSDCMRNKEAKAREGHATIITCVTP